MSGPLPGTYVLTSSLSEFRIVGSNIERMSVLGIEFKPFAREAVWNTIRIGEPIRGYELGNPDRWFYTSPVILVTHIHPGGEQCE